MRGIAVCGLGKLGAPLAAAFAASEIPVSGLDIDESKVRAINERRAPVDEPELEQYLQLPEVINNLWATTIPYQAIQVSDACLFVTRTPSQTDGSFDHSYLLNAMSAVAKEVARQRRRDFLFIVCSTVMPRFMVEQAAPLLRRILGDISFRLCYKPEFIALGTVLSDIHNPDMLLIGADDKATGEIVEELYRRVVFGKPGPIAQHMSLTEAELTKLSLNCAITMKISFANQVGNVAEKLGINAATILHAVGTDHRIGNSALVPGLPFGGPCFPRDNRAFLYCANHIGAAAPLSEATDVMNHRLLRTVITKVPAQGDVGILGLAYKPGTAVTDDSPGTWWRQALASRGRRVFAHDVRANHAHTIEEVLRCPTVIVACAWPQYRNLRIRPNTTLIDPMGIIARSAETLPAEVEA